MVSEQQIQKLEDALNKHPKKVLKRLKKQRRSKMYRKLPLTEQEKIDLLIDQLELKTKE